MNNQAFLTNNRYLKLPFAQLTHFLTLNQAKLHASEIRAVVNMHQFLRSLSIICYRIRENLLRFKPESWVNVNFDGLFLDTQSLFLFVQQFLEDMTLVIRLSFETSIRSQMSPKFSALVERLPLLLTDDHPLKRYLSEQTRFLLELKDLRDDILHRTGFGKTRSAEFPELMDFIRAAGGKAPFASGEDLRTYLSDCLKRIMTLVVLCDDLVRENLLRLYPSENTAYERFPLSFILPIGALNFEANDSQPAFELGTVMMTFDPELYESLMFFLQNGASSSSAP